MFTRRKKMDEYYINSIDNLREIVDNLEERFFVLQEFIEYFRSKSCEVIGLEKINDEWIVLYKLDTGTSLYIMLNKLEKFRPDWNFGILSSVYSDFHYKSEKQFKYVHIGDIQGYEKNNGYGSLLMKYLQKEVVKQNFTHIQGEIVSRDWDHIDRLEHFYKKHGFTVKINCDIENGEIKWMNKAYGKYK